VRPQVALTRLDSPVGQKLKLRWNFGTMAIEVLRELDDRIQASVNRIQQLQRENEQLAKRLAESEQRYSEASVQLREQETERNEIKSRIAQILSRFDGLDLG